MKAGREKWVLLWWISAVYQIREDQNREDQVREYFNILDVHKSVGPDGLHPSMLMEKKANGIARPPSMIFERWWQLGKVADDWLSVLSSKQAKRKMQALQAGQPHAVLQKMVEKILLESISKGMKNQKVLKSSQTGFLKGKSKTVYKTNPKLLNLSLSDLQDGIECTLKQVCRARKSGRTGRCSQLLCHP